MKEGSGTKNNLSVTIDKEILKKFRDYCDKNAKTYSKQVELLIINFFGGGKGNKK